MKYSEGANKLLALGVDLECPMSIEVGAEIDYRRIAASGVRIHTGCRLYGAHTFISSGSRIGTEGPVTIDNCYIGPEVELKSGYFKNAVFLEKASLGSGSHVREGTIVEELASTAHCVGLKQTILMPFVTLGSLINFCDCLMAGGTSRKNHSEVGSSYIHFNYTPNQDKATASLIGDVPKGVMLNQHPVFLGGQGGLVGPSRITYGTVIAAGSIYRKDQLKADRLVFEGGGRGGSVPYTAAIYRSVKRQAFNNFIYLANLMALMTWYTQVRRLFVGPSFPEPLYQGLVETLHTAIAERIKRFIAFCEKLQLSIDLYQQQMGNSASAALIQQQEDLVAGCSQFADMIASRLEKLEEHCHLDFLSIIQNQKNQSSGKYLDAIHGLRPEEAAMGTNWLQQIVDDEVGLMLNLFPSIR